MLDIQSIPTAQALNIEISKPRETIRAERERRRSSDPRRTDRQQVALQCWAMKPTGTVRGYVLDLSEHGALLGGISKGFVIGQGMLLKMTLSSTEPPIILRAEAVRWHERETGARHLAVRFLEVPFDDWFRLARFLDVAA